MFADNFNTCDNSVLLHLTQFFRMLVRCQGALDRLGADSIGHQCFKIHPEIYIFFFMRAKIDQLHYFSFRKKKNIHTIITVRNL